MRLPRTLLAGVVGILVVQSAAQGQWNEQKLNEPEIPPALEDNDRYGEDVAMSGGRAVVGAPGDDVVGGVLDNTGSVWVWSYVTAASMWLWGPQLVSSSPQANAAFGSSVAMNADGHVAVGAPGEDGYQGGAYVFHAAAGYVYNQMARLVPWGMIGGQFEPQPWDRFGSSVAFSGSTVLVGAPYTDRDVFNIEQGVVYVYQNDDTFPFYNANLVKLLPPSLGTGDHFGTSVDLKGHVAVIGAPDHDLASDGDREGVVYIYRRTPGVPPLWAHEETLYPDDAADRENAAGFGYSVAIDNERVVVGSPWLGVGGAAFLFGRNPAGDWVQRAKFVGDGTVNEDFGFSVDISGDRIVIGARYDDDEGSDAGAVYAFSRFGGSWVQTYKLTATDARADDRFGTTVGLDDSDLVVGAPYGFPDSSDFLNSGAAYANRGILIEATATFRNAGANPASYSVSGPPVLGTVITASIDLAGTTGHPVGRLIGYATPATIPIGGARVILVNLADPAGELLNQVIEGGAVITYSLAIPPDAAFAGLGISTQAIHFGGGLPFALSNAYDLRFGY